MLKSALLAKLEKAEHKKRESVRTKTPKKPKPEAPKARTPKQPEAPEVFAEEIRELGEKFRIDPSQVRQGVEGLIKFTSENPKLQNKLFDDDQFPIFLQINSIKIAKGHPKIVRIPLKHSMYGPESEICLIVADIKGIQNKKHEEHLEHYEKLLRQKGVEGIKKVMTFHEFRTEYETFELRSRLVELYDAFLVDGRISGKTVHKCGKIFYKKRKIPTSVRLQSTNLKDHIQGALRRTPLYLHSKGDSFVVQVGHSKMDHGELVENCFCVFKGLEEKFYGGFGNIRSINLFAHRGLTIPIYTTLSKQEDETFFCHSANDIFILILYSYYITSYVRNYITSVMLWISLHH